MKKTISKVVAALSIATMLLTASIPVIAAEKNITADYDLTQGGAQTFNLVDSEGNEVLIKITELPSTSRSLENRSYAVSYRSLLSWEAGYNVVIRNNSISSVNSPYYTCFIGSIYSASLKRDSSKQATLSFIYKAGGINNSTGVRTNIVNNQLKVSVL